jgi:CubicO group peptidase (beta-lactamase class C family)
LAKLGQLVLDDGVWQGQQIVSAGWIKEMTSRHNPDGMWFGFARGYGYLWWLGRSRLIAGTSIGLAVSAGAGSVSMLCRSSA